MTAPLRIGTKVRTIDRGARVHDRSPDKPEAIGIVRDHHRPYGRHSKERTPPYYVTFETGEAAWYDASEVEPLRSSRSPTKSSVQHSTRARKKPTAQLDREIAAALKPRVVCGECFSYAYQFATRKGGVLKHGTVTHPWDKTEFPHAWVEKGGKIYDWQTAEVRKTEPVPATDFYRHWKPRGVKSYTADDARAQVLKAKHYGPW